MPTIQATPAANLEEVKTGTDDFSGSDRLEIRDTLGDTQSANFDGQIRTCANSGKEAVLVDGPFAETEKTPENQGFSGITGGEGGNLIAMQCIDIKDDATWLIQNYP